MENRSLTNPAHLTATLLAFSHMASVSIVTPGLWLYVESLGHDYRYLGYAFAAPIIGGYLCGNALKPSSLENRTESKVTSPVPAARLKIVLGCFLCLGIAGHLLYGFWHDYVGLVLGRFLVGCCTGTMVLCQQIVENQGFRDDETTDDVLLRARMVFLGCVQALGTIFGLACGTALHEAPHLHVQDEKDNQHLACGIVGGALYILCFLAMLCSLPSNEFRTTKKECDCPPRNATVAARFGIFVPAIVYEHGQVHQTAALPDVFSTTVLLVFYFFVNNMLTGIEVLHGPFCQDNYGWSVVEIGTSWLAFSVFAMVACIVAVCLFRQVPCNRRLFGAVTLMFVTYGLQLQPHTPSVHYIGFLGLFACAFHIIDLAATEIYMDKIGEGEPKSLTALNKMKVMTWFGNVAALTRVLGAIVAGYIYNYYSSDAHKDRRPYALYAPPFAICVVLMGMCVIFYKRFQLRSQSEPQHTVLASEKESMLQPQQINCID